MVNKQPVGKVVKSEKELTKKTSERSLLVSTG